MNKLVAGRVRFPIFFNKMHYLAFDINIGNRLGPLSSMVHIPERTSWQLVWSQLILREHGTSPAFFLLHKFWFSVFKTTWQRFNGFRSCTFYKNDLAKCIIISMWPPTKPGCLIMPLLSCTWLIQFRTSPFKWLGFRRASQAGSIDDFTSTACGQKYRNDLRGRTVYGKYFRLIRYQKWPYYILKRKKREKKLKPF